MEQGDNFRSERSDPVSVDGLDQAGSKGKGENWDCWLIACGWAGIVLERWSLSANYFS